MFVGRSEAAGGRRRERRGPRSGLSSLSRERDHPPAAAKRPPLLPPPAKLVQGLNETRCKDLTPGGALLGTIDTGERELEGPGGGVGSSDAFGRRDRKEREKGKAG